MSPAQGASWLVAVATALLSLSCGRVEGAFVDAACDGPGVGCAPSMQCVRLGTASFCAGDCAANEGVCGEGCCLAIQGGDTHACFPPRFCPGSATLGGGIGTPCASNSACTPGASLECRDPVRIATGPICSRDCDDTVTCDQGAACILGTCVRACDLAHALGADGTRAQCPPATSCVPPPSGPGGGRSAYCADAGALADIVTPESASSR